MPPARKITVIFLLYTEAKYVPGLFQAILAQRHSGFAREEDWLEVIFVDNGSRDETHRVMLQELEKAGSPSNYQILHHERNLGISGALNDAFSRVRTPYVLTCHCDVLFGSDDYVAHMADLMAAQPKAGAIAGQPAMAPKKKMPFAEKVNLITNLMDIFPAQEGTESLVPVGFVEGRCEIFRLEALKAAGFYDTTLRLAGEDQVLAARMREAGYELYQAPYLRYYLSVSNDQDSLWKLVRHQRVFGRAHPYILLKNKKATSGVIGKSAGANRQLRTILRGTQILSSGLYLLTIAGLLAGISPWAALVPLLLAFLIKLALFGRHLAAVRFEPIEFALFFLFQPVLDVSYTWGLMQGLWLLTHSSAARPIS